MELKDYREVYNSLVLSEEADKRILDGINKKGLACKDGQPFTDSIDVRAYSLGTRVICMKLSCAITAWRTVLMSFAVTDSTAASYAAS